MAEGKSENDHSTTDSTTDDGSARLLLIDFESTDGSDIKTPTGNEPTEEEQEHLEEEKIRTKQNVTVSNVDNLCRSDSTFFFKDEAAYEEIDDYFH